MWGHVWRTLVGPPLKSSQATAEEITTPEGLAALSLDALSSVAYGPEAIALVLWAGGAAALRLLLPETLAIVGLLAILVLSYTQVIEAYPAGGGAYAVSRENLGRQASLVAAAALIVDYVLTVAVSVAAGIAALVAAFPVLQPDQTALALALLGLITLLNLRGVGESARAFMLPTYVFVVGLGGVAVLGLLHLGHPAAPPVGPAVPAPRTPEGGPLLWLKAFAAGCTALTGVEAIANGVPLFRPPRVLRAKRTEWLLGAILGALLLMLGAVVVGDHLTPHVYDTLLSQTLEAGVGRSWAYYVVALATTAVLGLAANTSFGSLPLLASVLARDGYLPRLFAVRGDRLVFNSGIWALAVAAALLLVATGGQVPALIPLFAIGVFTGFTLAQAGMVVHWWRRRPRGYLLRAGLNALGAAASGAATLVFLWSKFLEGAFVVVLAVPLLLVVFARVHRYYRRLDEALGIGAPLEPVHPNPPPLVVVLIHPRLSRLTVRALAEARALGEEVIALAVLFDPEGPDDPTPASLEAAWAAWNPPARLVTLHSQYHSVVRPVLRFLRTLERRAGQRVLVLIPEVVPQGLGPALLHEQMGFVLAQVLRYRTDVVVATLPLHLGPSGTTATAAPPTVPSEP